MIVMTSAEKELEVGPLALNEGFKLRSRFNLLMAVLISGVFVADLVLTNLKQLSGGFSQIPNLCFSITMLVILHLYSKWRSLPRFQHVCMLAVWAVIITNVLTILILLAGRSSAPLIDGNLARIDAALHFSTGSVVQKIALFPKLQTAFSILYQALTPLILLSVFVPPLCGREKESQRYVLSIMIAAIITAAAFALWPAAGPWMVFGFTPTRDQADVQTYLVSVLKSSAPAQVDSRSIGVVSFPSFHVVLALLSAIALWNVRRIRYVVVVIAAGICISTLTTGWHYLIDVVGGVTVVLASHALAVWMMTAVDRAVGTPRFQSRNGEPLNFLASHPSVNESLLIAVDTLPLRTFRKKVGQGRIRRIK
jgi:membrane-associated phospholipid phosphatase